MEQDLSVMPEEQEAVAGVVLVNRTQLVQVDFVYVTVVAKKYLMCLVSRAAKLLAHNVVQE